MDLDIEGTAPTRVAGGPARGGSGVVSVARTGPEGSALAPPLHAAVAEVSSSVSGLPWAPSKRRRRVRLLAIGVCVLGASAALLWFGRATTAPTGAPDGASVATQPSPEPPSAAPTNPPSSVTTASNPPPAATSATAAARPSPAAVDAPAVPTAAPAATSTGPLLGDDAFNRDVSQKH
jgi:hypothetical protein